MRDSNPPATAKRNKKTSYHINMSGADMMTLAKYYRQLKTDGSSLIDIEPVLERMLQAAGIDTERWSRKWQS